jgi:hypothetical protein
MEGIRWAVTLAFVVLGAMGIRVWWRHRSPATMWLSVMFASLGAALLLSRLMPVEPGGVWAAAGAVGTALVVLFPFLLFGFAESFDPVSPTWRVLVATLAAGMVVTTVTVTSITTPEGPEPAWYDAFVMSVIAVWTGLTGWVVWRMWSAGRRQLTLARRRMTTMAVAAGLLNVALVLAGAGESEGLSAAGQAVAFTSALTFVLAFSPPRFLRAAWRQADERALWHAEGDLVAADTREDVVMAVLPHVARLLGGEGAMFIDRAGNESQSGLDGSKRQFVRTRLLDAPGDRGVATLTTGVATLKLSQGRLGVATSAYTPLFGQDELELMERLGALLNLALSRVEASLTTTVLAAFEQGLIPDIDPPAGLLVETRYRAGLERLRLGGDFMDVVAIPDDAAGFIIGDVSGHGPEEAAFAVGVHAGWRTLAKVAPHNPSTWLALLDETFFGQHPERFVTAVAGRIDIAQRTVTLVSAGHHAPLVVGPETRILAVGPDPLLGIGHSERRKERTVSLSEQQGLLLYTDGLIEQTKPDRPDERWSEEDLLEWLARRATVDAIDLDELLWDFGRNSFSDDVAVMLLRFPPELTPPS